MASTPAVIMTMPPTKVRRKASLRARMRSAVDTVVLVMAWSPEVGGLGGARLVRQRVESRGATRRPPHAKGMMIVAPGGDLIRPRYLPETRNSGCTMPTFLGAILNAGYSGASNHSRVNSPGSIRLTVASQKPSNSRFSFQ